MSVGGYVFVEISVFPMQPFRGCGGGGAVNSVRLRAKSQRGRGGKGREEKDRERVALGYMNTRVRRVSGKSKYWAENNNSRGERVEVVE